MTTIPAGQIPREASHARELSFRILAGLLAAFTGIAMGGVFASLEAFTATGAEVIHQIHYVHWGAFMVVLTAVPLASLAVRPDLAAAQQSAVVVTAFVVATVAARMFDVAIVLFPVLIGVLLALHPARGRLLRRPGGLDATLGVLAAAVTLPSLWYAWSELQVHLAAPVSDPHRGPPEAHYVTGAALAFAIAGVAWLAALRTDGWRLPAWCAGAAMAMTGAASIWLPGWVSSFDRVWGAAAVVWGVAFIAAAEMVARRARSR